MATWFSEKLRMKTLLVKRLNVSADCVLFADHHLSHAASAFFCSPYEEAAVLTLDGVGEWTTTATGYATADWGAGQRRNQIVLDHEIRFPHSLGLLYSAFTAWLGFVVNNGEYKVMGMAPYGTPRYVDKVRRLIDVVPDGSFQLDMRYFSFHHSTQHTYNRCFVDLFGPPRHPTSEFVTELTHPGDTSFDRALKKANQYYADVAASIQVVTEETILAMVRDLHRRTGARNLCMTGGVALNSVESGRIGREGSFKQVWIQPAAGGSDGALGSGLWNTNAGEVVRPMHRINGKGIRLLYTRVSKAAVYLADHEIAAIARSTTFNTQADVLSVSGLIAGAEAKQETLRLVKDAVPDVPERVDTEVDTAQH